MSKHVLRQSLVAISVVLAATAAHADIFQWEYINPADPSQGKRQSTTLCYDGAGVDAVPGANLGRVGGATRDLTMAYGSFVLMRDMNFDIGRGDIFVIMGGSGCGKSTLLKHMIGLKEPAQGEIFYGETSFTAAEPEERERILRSCGVLYQRGALWSSMTLSENVALPLEQYTDLEPDEIREIASLKLALVGLKGFEHRYPHQLSGGQRKRVQMAQALITGPKVILMDEPFSALDIHTRHLMQNELLRLWQEERRAVVMITHDLEEAIALGDRVVVLAAGPRSRVIDSFPVDLERPRDVAEIKLDPRFMDLYRNIWSSLRGEVEKSYERHD